MEKKYEQGFHINLFAEDFTPNVWREYCSILGVPSTLNELTINTFSVVYEEDNVLRFSPIEKPHPLTPERHTEVMCNLDTLDCDPLEQLELEVD